MSLIYIARPELVPSQARHLPSAPFIVGVPRTGTTLLRMMLDAHPDLAIPAETDFLADVIPDCGASAYPAETFLSRIIGDTRWKDHQLDPLVLRRSILALKPFDIGEAIRTFYRLCGARWGKVRFGDKTPGYRNYMPMIQGVLPEARFLHILRDGRDVLLSHKLTWWAPSTLADAANLWTNEVRKARADTANIAYYMELRYEDLLRDTEGHLRKICAFLDLSWDSCMLQYHERSEQRLAEFSDCIRPDGKFISGDQWRGLHALTKKPPDTSRSGRWKQEMPESEQRQYETLAGDLLQELGYERRFGPSLANEATVDVGRLEPAVPLVTVARPDMVPVAARSLPAAPFIVGMPRSGTTLLRLMLDAHPAMAIPAETDFLADVIPTCQASGQPAEEFLARVLADKRFKDHQLDPAMLRQTVLAIQPFDVGEALRTFYRLCRARFGKPRFGDKTPGYRNFMTMIQDVLPEARFIHIIRDGRDVAVSHKSTWWGASSITEAASFWASEVLGARARSAELAYYMEIRYEDLLREPEASLRKVCSFLDLPWDDDILNYHERSEDRLAEFNDFVRPDGKVITAEARRGIQAMTKKPPDVSRGGRWKKEMPENEQREFEASAGEVLDLLGYERMFGSKKPPLLVIARPELTPVKATQLPPAPFIVGVDRSGTTLLRLMLDAHPALSIPAETFFLPELLLTCTNAADPAEFFLARVIGDRNWSDHRIDPLALRRRVLAMKPFDVGEGLRAFYRLCGERFGKQRFGDKTPGYRDFMPLIEKALPEARFIHIIRDGRDVALSQKAMWWGPKAVPELAATWVKQIQQARKAAAAVAHYLEIRYEDLLRETEATLKKICAFIDLPWDAGMLTYHERAGERLAELSDRLRPDGTVVTGDQRRDIHALTRKPPDASRGNRWKKEMSDDEQRQYEEYAGELLEELGYERRFSRSPRASALPPALAGGERLNAPARRLLFASYHCYVDPSSGAAQSARDLLPLLAARGWKCRVFCGPSLDFEDGRPFRQVMNSRTFGLGAGSVVADRPMIGAAVPCSLVDLVQGDIPITVFDAPHTRSLQEPARDEGYVLLAQFERLLDEFRPDMMLTYGGHWAAIEMMAAAHRRGIPIVFWLHNCFYHTGEFFKPMAGVIVPSQFAREHYKAKLKLDFTELPPPLDWPGRVCDNVEGKYVTLVNPQPDKGVFVFAAIAQELHRRRPDIPFLVVEGRSKLSWLRDAGLDLDKLGNVFGMGATTDPRTFYRVSKMVLMPSLWDETFGRVASEALANGIPVLASRRGGLPEALADAGFLFDVPAKYTPLTRAVPSPREVAPWVETIIRLWDDQAFYEKEQERCRAAARVWAPEKVGQIYDEYLTGLLDQSRQKAVSAAVARPLISVVMPIHNGMAYLERAVRSVQRQTFTAWELLAVDDGSTDASHNMLTQLAGEDPRIRIFKLPVNRGPSAARNHALSQARGDVICYLDCDDEYYPDNLERVWARHGEAEVLIYGYDVILLKPGSSEAGVTNTYDPRPNRSNLLQKKANMITGLGVAHRRALLERTGIFNESLSFEEDWDLWKRFVDAGASFAFLEHRSGVYHTRADSQARTRRTPHGRAASASDRPALENVTTTAPIFVLSAGGPGDTAIVERLLLSTDQVFLWAEQRGIFVENLLRIVEDMRGLLSWQTAGYREHSLENGENSPVLANHPDLAAIQDGCREFLERTLGLTARARGYPRWGMKETRYGRDAALFLQELYPDARFILLVRDPATSLQAIKATGWYGQDFGGDPAVFLRSWARISQELVAVRSDLRQAQLIRYEDLLAGSQQALQAISEVAGIPARLFDGKAFGQPPGALAALEDADWQALREAAVQGVAEKLGYEAKDGVLTSP